MEIVTKWGLDPIYLDGVFIPLKSNVTIWTLVPSRAGNWKFRGKLPGAAARAAKATASLLWHLRLHLHRHYSRSTGTTIVVSIPKLQIEGTSNSLIVRRCVSVLYTVAVRLWQGACFRSVEAAYGMAGHGVDGMA